MAIFLSPSQSISPLKVTLSDLSLQQFQDKQFILQETRKVCGSLTALGANSLAAIL